MKLKNSRASQGPSRIVIADDHPLYRSAIRQTLESHPDFEVVGEAANGREALELCRRLELDLVLMDLRMPVMDGVAATRAIKRESPKTLVLILTAIDESRDLSDSLKAGAAGYILKDAPAAHITHAVRRVLSGGSALNDELAMRLVMSLMDRESHEEQENHKGGSADSSSSERDLEERGGSHPAPSLTSREVEVLNAWCELSIEDLRGRCPRTRVGLLTNPEGKGTDSSCLTWTPSSPHFTSWSTIFASLIGAYGADPVLMPPSVVARSSPSLSSPAGPGSPAKGTPTATPRHICEERSLPFQTVPSSTASRAPMREPSRRSP
jgi:DNA-binding NarL/FixJ family response regulator